MFAPGVVLLKQWIGKDRFVKLRGQAIALHAEVITQFCNWIGVSRAQRQNLIRLARNNGKLLGLMT